MKKEIKVFIGMGSNIEPFNNIKNACILINEKIKILKISTFYRTEPIGGVIQPDFINGTVEAETDLTPEVLKNILLEIEKKLGRKRVPDKYSARTIDLDILLFGDIVIKNGFLEIPDPDIYRRYFLAYTLNELEPELILPDFGRSISSVCAEFKNVFFKPEIGFTAELKDLLK